MHKSAFALLLSFFIQGLQAQIDYDAYGIDTTYEVPNGLAIGDNAPSFTGTDSFGEKIKSKEVLKDHDIILIFYRGEWCPYCDMYLSRINDSLQYLEEHHAKVIAVAPENHTEIKKTLEKTGADFAVLSDHTEEIMKGFDVLFHVNEKYINKVKTKKNKDLAEAHNQDAARLPVPATYVIKQDGTISYKHFDYNYSERPSVKELVTHLSEN